MKRFAFLFIGITLVLSSCAVHNGLTYNENTHTTEVVLAKKNYKVIAQVKGQSCATYVFGVGGLKKRGLIDAAKRNMLSSADLIGGAKAIINETVETKSTLVFPFLIKKTVIVSAHVIEFTE